MIATDPILSWSAGLSLALLFGAAAWHKLRDPAEFGAALAAYRVVPDQLVRFVAPALAALEAAVAVGLLLRLDVAPAFAMALLVVYSSAMAWNLLRGRRYIDCGCGGAGQPVSWGLVLRNGVLLGVAALAYPSGNSLDVVGALTVAAVVVSGAFLYGAANHILTLRALLDEPEL